MACMLTPNRTAILALAAAGALWGLTVPLSKLSLEWLGPGWLTVARFAAAAPLLALLARRDLRGALAPRVVAAGAIGFGAVIVLQNAGIERTSVTHAALVVGAAPVLVALIAAGLGRSVSRPVTWGGYALALAGIAFVARAGGGEASAGGDLLVLASVAVSAAFIVVQPALLRGRDPAAVTAVQFAAGGLFAIPVAALMEGAPPVPAGPAPVVAVAALALVTNFIAALVFFFAWGAAQTLVIINAISLRQQVAPDHLQSRVNVSARMIAWGGMPFGAAVGGALAQVTSIEATYLVMALGVGISAAIGWFSPLRFARADSGRVSADPASGDPSAHGRGQTNSQT